MRSDQLPAWETRHRTQPQSSGVSTSLGTTAEAGSMSLIPRSAGTCCVDCCWLASSDPAIPHHPSATFLRLNPGFGGGTQRKISRQLRAREKISACIAGVRVTLPKRSDECGRTKL